jgi:hypothetical protein
LRRFIGSTSGLWRRWDDREGSSVHLREYRGPRLPAALMIYTVGPSKMTSGSRMVGCPASARLAGCNVDRRMPEMG